jgi:hypothetical protein
MARAYIHVPARAPRDRHCAEFPAFFGMHA